MTESSKQPSDALARLKAARDNREDGADGWIGDLPELPELPAGEKKVAVMIPKRDRSGSDDSDS
jgi:hypothetical protein